MGLLAQPVLLLAGGFTESDAKHELYAGGLHSQAAAGTSLVEATWRPHYPSI